MSSPLQTNITNLQNILNTINTLPEAGGGNIETCKLSLYVDPSATTDRYCAISYSIMDGDQIKFVNYNYKYLESELLNIGRPINTAYEIDSVVKNSLVLISMYPSNSIYSDDALVISLNGQYTKIDVGKMNAEITALICLGDVQIYESTPCFVRGTLITLSDNTVKDVCDINYNDNLLVWDFDNGCYASAKPLWIKKVQISNYYYHCEFENSITIDLVGSDGKCHRLFNVDDNYFESATDCVGKNIMTSNGISKLIKCERINDVVEFYNIITDYHLNLFANSILTSCRLNNIYPIENMKFIKDDREIISKDKYDNITDEFYYGLRLGERYYSDITEINNYVKRLELLKS